jgi:SpoVK/Ycf46/Vps4 family AAA+-type ATPase
LYKQNTLFRLPYALIEQGDGLIRIKINHNHCLPDDRNSGYYKKVVVLMKDIAEIVLSVFCQSLKDRREKTVKIANLPPPVDRGPEVTDNPPKNTPAVKNTSRDEMLKKMEVHNLNCTLGEMGGNNELKTEIDKIIQQCENPGFFRQRGQKFPKGILFYGPPGTGKTLAAKILVSAINNIKPKDIILFSPGFASFGLFKNEYDRNDQFLKLVKNFAS